MALVANGHVNEQVFLGTGSLTFTGSVTYQSADNGVAGLGLMGASTSTLTFQGPLVNGPTAGESGNNATVSFGGPATR